MPRAAPVLVDVCPWVTRVWKGLFDRRENDFRVDRKSLSRRAPMGGPAEAPHLFPRRSREALAPRPAGGPRRPRNRFSRRFRSPESDFLIVLDPRFGFSRRVLEAPAFLIEALDAKIGGPEFRLPGTPDSDFRVKVGAAGWLQPAGRSRRVAGAALSALAAARRSGDARGCCGAPRRAGPAAAPGPFGPRRGS